VAPRAGRRGRGAWSSPARGRCLVDFDCLPGAARRTRRRRMTLCADRARGPTAAPAAVRRRADVPPLYASGRGPSPSTGFERFAGLGRGDRGRGGGRAACGRWARRIGHLATARIIAADVGGSLGGRHLERGAALGRSRSRRRCSANVAVSRPQRVTPFEASALIKRHSDAVFSPLDLRSRHGDLGSAARGGAMG
jgi:hypothetical protein